MNKLFLLIALVLPMFSQADPGDEAVAAWDKVLKAHVSADGVVNYTAIKKDPAFDTALRLFATQHPDASWSKNEAMAFWINVYNAFTVKLIVDNMPVKSIMDLGKPWDKSFITLKGKTYSLNQIEHEILRPVYKDARVHFAINCASYSCPKLINAAFRAETLDATLTRVTKEFLKDTNRNHITANKAEVSQIFEWFADDFKREGDVIAFLNKYGAVKIAAGTPLQYLEYNWNLNGK